METMTNSSHLRRMAQALWRGCVLTTLRQRRMAPGGDVPRASALILPGRIVYVLDMQRLGGLSREKLLDEDFRAQLEDAMGGRRVVVTTGGGLAIQVGLDLGVTAASVSRLPASVDLPDEWLQPDPRHPYQVSLGVSRKGVVALDLAAPDRERALLIAGTSGFGKTTAVYALLAQVVRRCPPEILRLAIVDPKGDLALLRRVPHIWRYADGLGGPQELAAVVGTVEGEIARRQELFRAAGDTVGTWIEYNRRVHAGDVRGEMLPLVLLVIDELAELADHDEALAALERVARMGRAFGLSVVLATQYPTKDVVRRQIKVNMTAAIAFRVPDGAASRVILDRDGAEKLSRKGRCLLQVAGARQVVQAWRVERERLAQILEPIAGIPVGPALDPLEVEMVRYAVQELGGAFTLNKLYDAFRGQASLHALKQLGRRWQARGWLTEPVDAVSPRLVTPTLAQLAGVALDTVQAS
jgi:hypothetical protein